MAKVQIGRLEVEVPEASLYDAERVQEIERSINGTSYEPFIAAILLLCGDANPGLDAVAIKRALPFFGIAAKLTSVYRDVLTAAGILAPSASPGEAKGP